MQTIMQSLRCMKRYWFFFALFAICVATVVDKTGIIAASGGWLKNHHGPYWAVVCVFLFSGLSLSIEQLKDGLSDVRSMLLTFIVIFVAAPILAALFSRAPINTGIVIGLFLVAVMPSTLSSGVVMTTTAGGSAAHALVTTVIANSVSVFTIPYSLSILLLIVDQSAVVYIDKANIMHKIGFLVILPLAVGMTLKAFMSSLYKNLQRKINAANQCLILLVVWIAMSQVGGILFGHGITVVIVLIIVLAYHSLLLLIAGLLVRFYGLEKGRRESVIFVGSQKTLPLSIILQMSLFPQYSIALIVCVLHHVVHLMVDGYLSERMKAG